MPPQLHFAGKGFHSRWACPLCVGGVAVVGALSLGLSKKLGMVQSKFLLAGFHGV